MSKKLSPLEALEHIKTYARLDACNRCQYYKNGNCENHIGECMWKDEINIIETALKDCEMEHTLRIRLENANYELVRKQEKQDKILRIIKEKEVDVYFLKRMLIEWSSLYNTYGNDEKARKKYNEIHDKKLTKYEFDLLKEVLL